MREQPQSNAPEDGGQTGLLARHCAMQGTLAFDGVMQIDGRMDGEIVTNGTLIIGEHGEVNAEIRAVMVICGGKLDGVVIAKERVQLLASSIVTGTVNTPMLIIEEGAQFTGQCQMQEGHHIRRSSLGPERIIEREIVHD